MRKRNILLGVCAGLIVSVSGVHAQGIVPYGVDDCKAYITLKRTSGEFGITEKAGIVINPDTAKEIDGHYIAENAYGQRATQSVYKSLRSGQLFVNKTAPSGYISYYGFMSYSLNYKPQKSISQRYSQ